MKDSFRAGRLRPRPFAEHRAARSPDLVTRGQRVAPAQMVTLRLEGLDCIPATVRWVAGDEAGLSFDWPLYEPLRDHIVALRGTVLAGEKAA
jgi:hypothetical protein